MLKDRPQTRRTFAGGAVKWHAAIGGYRIVCRVVIREDEPTVVSVVENGQSVEQQELEAGASSRHVEEAALLLRRRYEPRIAAIAKRTWRFGRSACLTTSWAPRTPSPEDPAAA